ncbi:MAG: molecular chaperone [Parcubacteria group bacterium CG10_big_fil_rev_8_21_14_0_10_36_14]|nr:MAG: molecular chaperone [Parcubacteria group bacterium CG10_big_fil_rev_8_21_14_0_10_36_14]
MPIIKWNPFWMDDEFENIFNTKLAAFPIDVYEKDGKVIAEAPIPCVDPKKIEVAIENEVLTIKSTEEQKSEVEEKNYFRKEIRHGSFCRSVRLPVPVQEEKAEANFKDGVLTISIPKAKEEKNKKSIKIKVEER